MSDSIISYDVASVPTGMDMSDLVLYMRQLGLLFYSSTNHVGVPVNPPQLISGSCDVSIVDFIYYNNEEI